MSESPSHFFCPAPRWNTFFPSSRPVPTRHLSPSQGRPSFSCTTWCGIIPYAVFPSGITNLRGCLDPTCGVCALSPLPSTLFYTLTAIWLLQHEGSTMPNRWGANTYTPCFVRSHPDLDPSDSSLTSTSRISLADSADDSPSYATDDDMLLFPYLIRYPQNVISIPRTRVGAHHPKRRPRNGSISYGSSSNTAPARELRAITGRHRSMCVLQGHLDIARFLDRRCQRGILGLGQVNSAPSGVLQGSWRCCTVSCRALCKRGQLVSAPHWLFFFVFFVSATYSRSATSTSLSTLLEGSARAAGSSNRAVTPPKLPFSPVLAWLFFFPL